MGLLLTEELGRIGAANGHEDALGCREGTADADVEEMVGVYAGMSDDSPTGSAMTGVRRAGCV